MHFVLRPIRAYPPYEVQGADTSHQGLIEFSNEGVLWDVFEQFNPFGTELCTLVEGNGAVELEQKKPCRRSLGR